MSVFDLVIRGGTVVTPGGVVEADVVVQGGRIVGLTAGELTPAGREEVDASGRVVIPGGIDTHTHLREPGFTYKEDITTGSRAAAAGGYTTVVGMPNVQPPTTTVERYRETIALYEQKCLVDFNHNPAPTNLAEIAGLAEAGALGFKLFMITDTGTDYPHMPGLGVHHQGRLLEIAEAVAATGRPLMVHANNQEVMETIEHRVLAQGDTSYRAFAKVSQAYDGIGWDTAVSFLVRLQEVTGMHLHVLHVRSVRMLEVLRAAKQRGQKVTTEINPHVVFLCNDWDEIERLGPYALSVWNGPDTTEPLWQALLDGTIDVLATDHAPHTREDKEIGWTDMWKAANGVPKLQEVLSLFLTEVNRGRISLERLVELFSTGPARVFGLYPRKGAIAVGSDADLVVVDLERPWTIRNEEMLSKCGWTPFHGREVQGVPVHTLVRGRFVVRDRQVVGEPGWGQHARPGAPSAVGGRPSVGATVD